MTAAKQYFRITALAITLKHEENTERADTSQTPKENQSFFGNPSAAEDPASVTETTFETINDRSNVSLKLGMPTQVAPAFI